MAEVKRTYYQSGALHTEYIEIDGKKNGEYKCYWPNGQLSIICSYIDDEKIE